MNAPLDIDLGTNPFMLQRKEHDCASLDAICDEEAERAERIAVKQAKDLIKHYKRLADAQRGLARDPAIGPISRMSMEHQATDYERFAHELRGLIR